MLKGVVTFLWCSLDSLTGSRWQVLKGKWERDTVRGEGEKAEEWQKEGERRGGIREGQRGREIDERMESVWRWQRDSEMNEGTLKKRKDRSEKAYRQIAVPKVEVSRGSRVYGCSRLNCSKYAALNASDVTLPYKTVKNPLLPDTISATIRPIEDKKGDSRQRGMKMRREEWEVRWRWRLGRAADGGLALGSWLTELAPSHTATLEWMGCSDGCLNRLIGLASREIRTDG